MGYTQGTGLFLVLLSSAVIFSGCQTHKTQAEKRGDHFTSGSPEADRRAKRLVPDEKKPIEENRTLYDRLGGEAGIAAIVDDFLRRVMEDPRVNWTRHGVSSRSWLRSKKAPAWSSTPENVAQLKKHFVQFISLAAGGPVKYEGQPLAPSHESMQIKKVEFDATIGDLKATLDKLGIAPEVQKDLVAIMESTRPQIVPDRRR